MILAVGAARTPIICPDRQSSYRRSGDAGQDEEIMLSAKLLDGRVIPDRVVLGEHDGIEPSGFRAVDQVSRIENAIVRTGPRMGVKINEHQWPVLYPRRFHESNPETSEFREQDAGSKQRRLYLSLFATSSIRARRWFGSLPPLKFGW